MFGFKNCGSITSLERRQGAIPTSTSEATHAPDANEVLSLGTAELKC